MEIGLNNKERCKKCNKYHFKVYNKDSILTLVCANCGQAFVKMKIERVVDGTKQ